MGKVMRHTLGASLNIRHNLSSSKGPKPLQLKLLTTYIPKTSAFTLAFSTSQRLRTTRASARTFFTKSPMLGFHKQMDNRIKLLEEILSFRMQGVEFDNGDMYVDGHKAASDVRDEFVSVTEKLMDELAQCYNVLPQLDINNT